MDIVNLLLDAAAAGLDVKLSNDGQSVAVRNVRPSNKRFAMLLEENRENVLRSLRGDSGDEIDGLTSLHHATLEYARQVSSDEIELLHTTGLPDLDHAIGGGYAQGELIVIAARPSQGKSLLALQLMHEATKTRPGLLISEEMSLSSLAKRTLQYVSEHHPEYWFNHADEINDEINRHFRARNDCLVFENARSIDKACDIIRETHERYGIRVAAVDYVQLLSAAGNGRYESVTAASIALRQVCNETGVTLFVLAQLNREIENRRTYVPKMSDLKESGQLEQDADVVLMLVWPHRIDSTATATEYQIYVMKNRNREVRRAALQLEIEPSRQRIVGGPSPHDFGEFG